MKMSRMIKFIITPIVIAVLTVIGAGIVGTMVDKKIDDNVSAAVVQVEAEAGDVIQFTDESTNGPTAWLWDFGDGATSTQQNPTHVYSETGTYTVKLTVTNAGGSDEEVKSDYIVVTNGGNPGVHAPVAAFSAEVIDGSTPPPPPPVDGVVRLNMKSYGNHNAAYDARIKAMRPEYVIDNPVHGPYGELYGYDSWLLSRETIADWQSVGIKVVGYLTGGYEGDGTEGGEPHSFTELAFNKMCIEQMAEDGCDGVFIDECSEQPQNSTRRMNYLTELTSLAHSLGMMTWGNTGVNQFSSWFFTDGGCDLMQSSEAWRGQSLSSVQQQYGDRISVTGWSSSYSAQDAYDLTIDAWEKGIAYCYINNVEYVSVAPWFEDYVEMLRAYQGIPGGGGNDGNDGGDGGDGGGDDCDT